MPLLSIFQYGFMLRAIGVGCVVGVIAPMIGMFLVTRRYSFMADTLAHVSLAGVAGGMLLGIHPVLSAMAAALVAAFSVETLRSTRRLVGETALSIFLSGGLGLSSVLLGLQRGGSVSLGSVLFGSISTVTPSDVWLACGLGAAVFLAVILAYQGLFAVAHDEEMAIAAGLPVRFLNLLLVTLAAVTVSVTMRIVGVLLVGALMVIPVAAALQLKLGFFKTLLASVAFSLIAVLVGLTLSFQLGLASGGMIVLSALAVFVGCAAVGRGR